MANDIPRLKYHTAYIITVPNEEYTGEAFGLPFLKGRSDLRGVSNLASAEKKAARTGALYECHNAGYTITREDGEDMEFLKPGEMTVKDKQFPDEVPIEERILTLLQAATGTAAPTNEDFKDAVKTAVAEQLAEQLAELKSVQDEESKEDNEAKKAETAEKKPPKAKVPA